MANDNIFQQYLRPAKSVADYSAEMDEADARKSSLAQNALALAAGQQKFAEGQQANQRAAQLRSVLAGLPQGATDDQRIQAMRGAGSPEGFAAADALDKSLVDRQKGLAAAGKDEADAGKTNLARQIALHDYHAQKLSTVQTPEDALAWAAEGKQLGVFEQPGQYERGVGAIQQAAQSPQAFAQWRAAAMQGGQSVTEQLKQKMEADQQAEKVRQFNVTDKRIQSEGAANRGVTMRGQNMADARAREAAAAGGSDAPMDPLTVHFTAQQVLAGDNSAMQNLGRGAQGAANINAIRAEATKMAIAQGMTGADLAAKNAEFFGTKAGQRTAATRSANIEIAAQEVQSLAPIALDASSKVARSGMLPFGKAQIMFDNNTNDPNMRQFAMANTALVNAYGQAMARGGSATVSDKDHARELLSTAFDQASYAKAVQQLQVETRAAQAAPKAVRKELSSAVSGRGDSPPAAPPGLPDDIAALVKKHGTK